MIFINSAGGCIKILPVKLTNLGVCQTESLFLNCEDMTVLVFRLDGWRCVCV